MNLHQLRSHSSWSPPARLSCAKVIWIFVRGIAGNASDLKEWEQGGVDWVLQDQYCRERGFVARCDSYECSFLTVWMNEPKRARQLAAVIRSYLDAGYEVHLVGHSNGTRVIREALKLLRWPKVGTVHFVCGACDSDFERTGLNYALKHHRIERFYYYVGGRDWAMKLENTFLGKLDFALPEKSCPMGLRGPRNVAKEVRNRVIDNSTGWERFGHGTCFTAAHFNNTLKRITRTARADVCA